MIANRETATLAGGCFWCLEAVFQPLQGVERIVSGYTGGVVGRPTYEDVCTGTTGHAEAVQVTFDPAVLSYRGLLELFFAFHDPTTANRQGADVGTQYRSAIFYHTAEQELVARELIAELERERVFPDPIVTEVVPLREWHPAEAYHQGYYERNPDRMYCRAVIAPKVARLRKKYGEKLRPTQRSS
ncbi:MAG TPA: peptide-methionine (S)-S-oxide reductase MsrA [Gemmatimonadales bacterium]|jgi:peptide-methionine (S)-S-oxide reductase|nr:peptide-methionine (S)-S-oxide reductase MsrA [Gemmatimonadales bacterium]